MVTVTAFGAVNADVPVAAAQVEAVGAVAKSAAGFARQVGPGTVVVGPLHLVVGGVSGFPIDSDAGQRFSAAQIQGNPAGVQCMGGFPAGAAVAINRKTRCLQLGTRRSTGDSQLSRRACAGTGGATGCLLGIHLKLPNGVTPVIARAALGAVDAHIAEAAGHRIDIGAVAKGAAGNGFKRGPVSVVVGALD